MVTVCAVGLAAYSTVVTQATVHNLDREGLERRDQSCLIFERKQKSDVDQLERTYTYLVQLSPAERKSPINRAVLAQLPITEAAAREDDAPAYCDEKGVGLPEPDPVVPPRPSALR